MNDGSITEYEGTPTSAESEYHGPPTAQLCIRGNVI